MTSAELPRLGVGIGWRSEIDLTVERLNTDFVEFIAEDVDPRRIPESLQLLRRRGTPTLPHAVSLSLVGVEPVHTDRVRQLAQVAAAVEAPLVSDHIAFTRAGDWEARHICRRRAPTRRWKCWWRTCNSSRTFFRSRWPWSTWPRSWSGPAPSSTKRSFWSGSSNAPAAG